MSKKLQDKVNLGMTIGTLGVLAGIALLFTESWFIGVFGGIVSAGMAYKGYRDLYG